MSLVGEAERALMRSKSVAAFNGEVFLQQRDEAAVVARSALSDIVGSKVKGTSAAGGKLFRMMQVEHHASASIFFVFVVAAAVSLLLLCMQSYKNVYCRWESCRFRCRSCCSSKVRASRLCR